MDLWSLVIGIIVLLVVGALVWVLVNAIMRVLFTGGGHWFINAAAAVIIGLIAFAIVTKWDVLPWNSPDHQIVDVYSNSELDDLINEKIDDASDDLSSADIRDLREEVVDAVKDLDDPSRKEVKSEIDSVISDYIEEDSASADKESTAEAPPQATQSLAEQIVELCSSDEGKKLPICQNASAPPAPDKNADQPQNGDKCVDHEMHEGDVYYMNPDCHVKGDVEVSNSKNGPWEPLFDDVGSTGLIVTCPEGCYVHVPDGNGGANVSPRTVDDLEAEMLESGCENQAGCTTVDKEIWPWSDDTSEAQAQPTEPVYNPPATDPCALSIPKKKDGEDAVPVLVPANCRISGDVEVSDSGRDGPFTPLYDSDQATGLVVSTTHEAWYRSPWGASASSASVEDLQASQMAVGCGLATGCEESIPVTH